MASYRPAGSLSQKNRCEEHVLRTDFVDDYGRYDGYRTDVTKNVADMVLSEGNRRRKLTGVGIIPFVEFVS